MALLDAQPGALLDDVQRWHDGPSPRSTSPFSIEIVHDRPLDPLVLGIVHQTERAFIGRSASAAAGAPAPRGGTRQVVEEPEDQAAEPQQEDCFAHTRFLSLCGC